MGASVAANAIGPVIRGRRGLFGYTVGILVLETTIPRLPGAIGNASTFPFPVLQRVVPGASGEATVRALGRCKRGTPEFAAATAPWLQAARDIVAEGAKAVTTSCGFTAVFQRELTEAVDAPVFASSLLLAPLIQRMLKPDRVVGAIVADSRSMS
ncbi:MAG: aspartate/glutamate racemase family protein, partial [Alphaproteobacteria bacterium]|nr:aspartate/glutamate racemase family protein [Alphaproteobacteria bacterium]